jgi:predicted dehydrogenase
VTGPAIRIGVVGFGHLGRHHVRLLAEEPRARLTAVAECNEKSLAEAVGSYEVAGFSDYREMLPLVDAVTVVVPTGQHLEVARFFLENGVDVLVEKPIAATAKDGREMVETARRGDRILQVGHVERFNRALAAIRELAVVPRYI